MARDQIKTTDACPACGKVHEWDADSGGYLYSQQVTVTWVWDDEERTTTVWLCACGATIAVEVGRIEDDHTTQRLYLPTLEATLAQ